MESELKTYFEKREPRIEVAGIRLLDDGNSSHHLNYKVETADGEVFVARVAKPDDVLSSASLADEFLILKLVEQRQVAPKAYSIDLENFSTPLLTEECIEGISFSEIQNGTDDQFDAVIRLLVEVSTIRLTQEQFPFKSAYTTYVTNFRTWDARLKKIAESGEGKEMVGEFTPIVEQAHSLLTSVEPLLQDAPIEFIYNDVHTGNLFWLPQSNSAKFIDWQKVSLGDPTFMAALFARRFSDAWGKEASDFTRKVSDSYQAHKQVPNFEKLLKARMLERAVSDMIWTVWAKIQKGEGSLPHGKQNPYLTEARGFTSAW